MASRQGVPPGHVARIAQRQGLDEVEPFVAKILIAAE
jgi:hypothetical protein